MDPRARWRTHPGTGLRVTWLGHSTLVAEVDLVEAEPAPAFDFDPSAREFEFDQSLPDPLDALPSDGGPHLPFPAPSLSAQEPRPTLAFGP
jgi:hypothetical protein